MNHRKFARLLFASNIWKEIVSKYILILVYVCSIADISTIARVYKFFISYI